MAQTERTKMIKIKASLLKWVSVDFEFWYNEEQYSFEGIDADGDIFYENRCGFVAPDYDIHIDEKEYEKEIVNHIKEMFDGEFSKVISIKKAHCNGVVVTMNTPSLAQYKKYGEKDSGTPFTKKSIWVNCDPRPNIKEYEITI